MILVHGPELKQSIGDWVSRLMTETGEVGFEGKYNAIGVVRNEELVAGFVYHDWNPKFRTIHMTLASTTPRWASRKIICGLLRYPFIEIGVQRITVTVRADNEASLRLAEGVGFKREARLERAAGMDNDIIVLRLFIEEWKRGVFSEEKARYGKTEST